MSLFMLDAQRYVYENLNGAITGSVYNDVPPMAPGDPAGDYPYTVIGYDSSVEFDTDSWNGERVTIQLDVWSSGAGAKETKEIMGEIYALLQKKKLRLPGWILREGRWNDLGTWDDAASWIDTPIIDGVVVDCLHVSSNIPNTGTGTYVHGVCQYLITITEDI